MQKVHNSCCRAAFFRAIGWSALVLPGCFLSVSAETSAAAESAPPVHWSYNGDTGAAHWGSLATGTAVCGNGKLQSPINLDTHHAITAKTEDFKINYEPGAVALLNNGHTVQADVSDAADTVSFEGNSYKLTQFHFHTPSEHTVNNKHYPLEIHFVNTDAAGHITVVGVLVRSGAENKDLAAVFDTLPATQTPSGSHAGAPVTVDLADILPKNHQAYVYTGSLTTPPCTEGVHWVVLMQPIEMSNAQIAAFARVFHDNHRQTQSLNGREVDRETE